MRLFKRTRRGLQVACGIPIAEPVLRRKAGDAWHQYALAAAEIDVGSRPLVRTEKLIEGEYESPVMRIRANR